MSTFSAETFEHIHFLKSSDNGVLYIDWVFGLCTSSSILKTRKCNISVTGSVSATLCFLVLEYWMMVKVQKPSYSDMNFSITMFT
jgi:hypothetical protein